MRKSAVTNRIPKPSQPSPSAWALSTWLCSETPEAPATTPLTATSSHCWWVHLVCPPPAVPPSWCCFCFLPVSCPPAHPEVKGGLHPHHLAHCSTPTRYHTSHTEWRCRTVSQPLTYVTAPMVAHLQARHRNIPPEHAPCYASTEHKAHTAR